MKPLADVDGDLIPPDLPARHHLYDAFELIVQRSPPAAVPSCRRRARPLKRLFEARGVDRFQQVVDRVDLEGLDRVLVERRDKYECR